MDTSSNTIKTRAANKLARFWRIYKELTLAHIVTNFARLGMLEANVKEIRSLLNHTDCTNYTNYTNCTNYTNYTNYTN